MVAPRAGDVDRQRRRRAAQRSAANASSVAFTAAVERRTQTDSGVSRTARDADGR